MFNKQFPTFVRSVQLAAFTLNYLLKENHRRRIEKLFCRSRIERVILELNKNTTKVRKPTDGTFLMWFSMQPAVCTFKLALDRDTWQTCQIMLAAKNVRRSKFEI